MMLKLPKGQKKKKLKKKNQKIQSFKSIEIKQYIYIYGWLGYVLRNATVVRKK